MRCRSAPQPGKAPDPELDDLGWEQARRLPQALARFPISRLVSSPQIRAIQTAEPVADLAGYGHGGRRTSGGVRPWAVALRADRGGPCRTAGDWARMALGHLPESVDSGAFRSRVRAALADIVDSTDHRETAAVVSHGGVINRSCMKSFGTARLLSFPIDYASVTQLRHSWRAGPRWQASTSSNTSGTCCPKPGSVSFPRGSGYRLSATFEVLLAARCNWYIRAALTSPVSRPPPIAASRIATPRAGSSARSRMSASPTGVLGDEDQQDDQDQEAEDQRRPQCTGPGESDFGGCRSVSPGVAHNRGNGSSGVGWGSLLMSSIFAFPGSRGDTNR